jgi:hypothetical protein
LRLLIKTFVAAVLGLAFVLTCACRKPAPKDESNSIDPLNRVESAPKTASLSLVHGTLKVGRYAKFEFEVPPHSVTPRLQGSFEVPPPANAVKESDQDKIDFLVMTQDEFEDFARGRSGTASYSVTGVHAQTIDYALASTLDSSQKYYAVFRNPAGKAHTVSVTADLTVSF